MRSCGKGRSAGKSVKQKKQGTVSLPGACLGDNSRCDLRIINKVDEFADQIETIYRNGNGGDFCPVREQQSFCSGY